MRYRILNTQEFSYKDYELIPFREEDLMKIRQWRNDQMDVLRQKKEIGIDEQRNYYDNVIKPLFNNPSPPQVLFSFLQNKVCIGYGGLVHINWEDKRGEVSFLVDTKRTSDKRIYKSDFLSYLEMIKKVAFEEFNFNRIFTETYDIRTFHISVLEQSGFKLEGVMREHVLIDGSFRNSLIHGFLKNDRIDLSQP